MSTAVHRMSSDTPMPSAPSIHQTDRPARAPATMSAEAMASLRWCQPSALTARELIFRPAQKANCASASFSTIEPANTTIAATENVAAWKLMSRRTESRKKLPPTTASSTPITMAEMPSARAWPKGCSLSAGRAMMKNPTITTTEVRVSLRVCQASAVMDTEPLARPNQYFTPKSRVLITTEIQPSSMPRFGSAARGGGGSGVVRARRMDGPWAWTSCCGAWMRHHPSRQWEVPRRTPWMAMTPLPSEPGLQDLFFQPGDADSDSKPAAG